MRKLLIAALIIVVAAVAWHKVVEDLVIPKKFGVVEPGSIYRSGQISFALMEKVLTKYGIKRIVALTGEKKDDIDVKTEIETARKLGIELLRYPMAGNGTANDPNLYVHAVIALDESVKEHKPVLVHCAAGAQRTGGVVAVYRLLIQGKQPDEVIAEMKKYGHDPQDNPALFAYLNENMATFAQKLYENKVIEEIPAKLPKLPQDSGSK